MSEAADQYPHDVEAERQVLGAVLVRPDLLIQVNSILSKEDYFFEAHSFIYDSVLDLYNRGNVDFDAVQVVQSLQDRGLIDPAGGAPYIMRLAQDVIAPGNVMLHARRLRSLALRRQLMQAANSILEDASRPNEDENVFLRNVEERILRITNSSFAQGIVPVRDLKKDFADYLQTLIEARGAITGTSTGFHEFDNLTSGLKGGELIILAARPGVGKTTLALNMASNVAMLHNKPVLVFSLEMSNMELMMRLVCSDAMFNHGDLKRGNIGNRAQQILGSIEKICASPLHIDDSGDLDIWECMTRTRKFKVDMDQRGEGIGLVIIDYLQLMSDPSSRKLGRQHEVAMISRSLKQLAKAVNAPILALSQMNRSVEQRRGDSARPQLSDLRESGAIEQDADMVLFIHQAQQGEAESVEDLENQGTVEVIIAKHRSGPTGAFRLAFRPEINRFDNRVVEAPAY
ncbi:MAG: replicative DNA helicase [Leptospiraceae bacterium]|nr:replicative DNA helicase [Leptospiraceae bacterium]